MRPKDFEPQAHNQCWIFGFYNIFSLSIMESVISTSGWVECILLSKCLYYVWLGLEFDFIIKNMKENKI